MASPPKAYSFDVFINCPFDNLYEGLFRAMIFCVYFAGFRPRCAKEASDAGEIRLQKIMKIMSECKYSIHDISRTDPDKKTRLPRFNMPLELGIDLGCRTFATGHLKKKTFLILDKEKYRYDKFISDIKGQDISSHGNKQRQMIYAIRNWLSTESKRTNIPGGAEIYRCFNAFKRALPGRCRRRGLEVNDLTFNDLAELVYEWLADNRD